VSKELFYENDWCVERYRIIVNGNQLWDVGVGHIRGAGIYKATPGWKVSETILIRGNDFEKNNIYNINTLYAKLGGESSFCKSIGEFAVPNNNGVKSLIWAKKQYQIME
jgi:hypothetical protein